MDKKGFVVIALIGLLVLIIAIIAAFKYFAATGQITDYQKLCLANGFKFGREKVGLCLSDEKTIENACCSNLAFGGTITPTPATNQSNASNSNTKTGTNSNALTSNYQGDGTIEDFCKWSQDWWLVKNPIVAKQMRINKIELSVYEGVTACHFNLGVAQSMFDEYFTQVRPHDSGKVVWTTTDKEMVMVKESHMEDGKCINYSCSGKACVIADKIYGEQCH